MDFVLVPIIVAAILMVFFVMGTVRVVPQARRYIIERFGRYRTTLQPGLNFIIPAVDRINSRLDIREQVFTSAPQPVITQDNLVVNIDTVLYYQITDPRAAVYEVANYLQAIDQLTVTTLRNVIGSMDLERTLTSREEINAQLRTVLDDATGKWGIRMNRVEIKAIDPPATIKEAMEKQMRAERDKRATILHAEGERQAKILTAEGTRQQSILEAQGDQQAAILRADGEAKAIDLVFQAVHRNDADPKVLAYKYLEMLPQLAEGDNNTLWVIPGELTRAIQTVTEAFSDQSPAGTRPQASQVPAPPTDPGADAPDALEQDREGPDDGPRALTGGAHPAYDVAATLDQAAEMARRAVDDAKADAAAAEHGGAPGDL
ncbi:Regulator of protease activity HflC, stomatin/prohibitin superfamily [Raineyella antarctica]|uniref:Regulator of protease activity HflC, stomatin/prohibitin superfamily n=1 Tax=Raineyella antarctica TaxID=1577474 RepID=A0A1G6GNS7_9ACTN|nr:SPFH domain-containing protein [Raineyella antarctica]SDB83579.1 Regulator of protease activity HflC, stomatin/prohibitin superfamily [Raineyella antarctica]